MSLKSTDHKSSSDEELYVLAAKGNRLAFELLFDRYFTKLVWFANGFLKDQAMAKDVVQDTFVKLIEKPQSFDPGKRFSTWIYTVTGKMCRNILRNEENRRRILNENPVTMHTAPEHSRYDHNLLQKKLQEALNHLSEKEKNIYALRFEEQMSIKELAEIMKIPEGSVKSGIFHLLKKLSIKLKDFTHAK